MQLQTRVLVAPRVRGGEAWRERDGPAEFAHSIFSPRLPGATCAKSLSSGNASSAATHRRGAPSEDTSPGRAEVINLMKVEAHEAENKGGRDSHQRGR
jgi:hypothetical protein